MPTARAADKIHFLCNFPEFFLNDDDPILMNSLLVVFVVTGIVAGKGFPFVADHGCVSSPPT